MAIAGQRPKASVTKLATGNPGKRPIAPAVDPAGKRTTPLDPPKKLTKAQRALWVRFIDTAWWLSEHDVTTAFVWVRLQAEFLKAKDAEITASMVAQIRSLASELGLNTTARARLGIDGVAPAPTDPAERFFD